MNRRKLKEQAKAAVAAQGSSARRVTLIYLVSVVALAVLRYLIGELPGIIPVSGHRLSDTFASGAQIEMFSFAITFLLQLVLVLLSAGYVSFSLSLHRGQDCETGSLLEGFRNTPRVILLYLLETIFLSLWTYVLSLIPSFLFSATLVSSATDELTLTMQDLYPVFAYVLILMWVISYRYRTSYFRLMANPDMSPRFALNHAKLASRGYRFQLFLLDLSFLPWILLSILTCGILLIWKLPYITATYAGAYEEIENAYWKRMSAIFGNPSAEG